MTIINLNAWIIFCEAIVKLQSDISKSQAVNVNSSSLRQRAKEVAQSYFRQARPELQTLSIKSDYVSEIDEAMQLLLKMSNGKNSKRAYLNLLKPISNTILDIDGAIELRHSERAFQSLSAQSSTLSDFEVSIYDTLLKLVPTAALSYKQAIIDIADKKRASYRGTANELREALRETLDHLAPDAMVVSQPNFKYEKEKTTPTMKQKVRFILKARGLPSNAMKPPEEAVEMVEERIAAFARAIYERSSISTHVASERSEVIQMKNYVNAVLAELLVLQT